MSQAAEPAVFANGPLWIDILQQLIFYLAISTVILVHTTKILEIVPIRRPIGLPEKRGKFKIIFLYKGNLEGSRTEFFLSNSTLCISNTRIDEKRLI